MAIITFKRKPRHQVLAMSIEPSPQRYTYDTQPPSSREVLAQCLWCEKGTSITTNPVMQAVK